MNSYPSPSDGFSDNFSNRQTGSESSTQPQAVTFEERARMLGIEPLEGAELNRLIQSAIEARDHAYAPHSHFYVGAAIMLADGTIYNGCNVENASYSLTQCAERVAVTTAVAQGYRSFRAVAIASVGGAMPCGACRQVLAEFGMNLLVYTVDVIDGEKQKRLLSDLLPDAFSTADIPST